MNNSMQLRYQRLSPEVSHPSFGTTLSACFDLEYFPSREYISGYESYNAPMYRKIESDKSIVIMPSERLLLPTGLIFQCVGNVETANENINTYSIRLYSRSGMAIKRGLVLINSVGVIDVDYQEEVFIPIVNTSKERQVIAYKERICQAEIVQNVRFTAVESLHKLERLSERIGGFGSTGS